MKKSSIKNEMNFELFESEKEAQYRLGRIDINFTFLLYPVKLYAIVNPLLINSLESFLRLVFMCRSVGNAEGVRQKAADLSGKRTG